MRMRRYYPKLSLDFEVNKRICDEIAIIASKRLRNKIAGYTTHLYVPMRSREQWGWNRDDMDVGMDIGRLQMGYELTLIRALRDLLVRIFSMDSALSTIFDQIPNIQLLGLLSFQFLSCVTPTELVKYY